MQSPSERAKSVPGSLTLFHELSSSLITKIYLCDFNNTKAVIRFDLAAASQLSINRQNEVNLLKSIGSLSIAPEVLYSDAEGGILIWKYIIGEKPSFNKDRNIPYSLFDLGACLYSLHSLPIPKKSIDIFSNSMALYQSLLDKKSDKLLFDKALALHNRINADGVEKVFSHNDLHSSNLLWNQKYYFLDWEYSGLNHPCFDIASLVKNLELSQSQISELSNGYKGSNEFFHRSKLDEWIEFIDCLNKIWDISVQKIVENLELNKYL